jgi:uncharacterized protein YkwD
MITRPRDDAGAVRDTDESQATSKISLSTRRFHNRNKLSQVLDRAISHSIQEPGNPTVSHGRHVTGGKAMNILGNESDATSTTLSLSTSSHYSESTGENTQARMERINLGCYKVKSVTKRGSEVSEEDRMSPSNKNYLPSLKKYQSEHDQRNKDEGEVTSVHEVSRGGKKYIVRRIKKKKPRSKKILEHVDHHAPAGLSSSSASSQAPKLAGLSPPPSRGSTPQKPSLGIPESSPESRRRTLGGNGLGDQTIQKRSTMKLSVPKISLIGKSSNKSPTSSPRTRRKPCILSATQQTQTKKKSGAKPRTERKSRIPSATQQTQTKKKAGAKQPVEDIAVPALVDSSCSAAGNNNMLDDASIRLELSKRSTTSGIISKRTSSRLDKSFTTSSSETTGKARSILKLEVDVMRQNFLGAGRYANNLILVNAERIKIGLHLLRRNANLDEMASLYAKEMSASSGATPIYTTHCGNVMRGPSIRTIHASLMERERECGNILNPAFQDFGMGTQKGEDGMLYLCQLFSFGTLALNCLDFESVALPSRLAQIDRNSKTSLRRSSIN